MAQNLDIARSLQGEGEIGVPGWFSDAHSSKLDYARLTSEGQAHHQPHIMASHENNRRGS